MSDPIYFGHKFEGVVSPGLVLAIATILEEWLIDLSQMESVDTFRHSVGMAQKVVAVVARYRDEVAVDPESRIDSWVNSEECAEQLKLLEGDRHE